MPDMMPALDATHAPTSYLTTISRIYCGMSRPDGSSVTDADMADFVASVLAREFPDGFTILHADGGWADLATGATIREPSTVIEVAHGNQDTPRVLAVASAYKRQFAQQAVMVAAAPIAVQFV